ncbi:hypothetical protein PsYK624_059570 [Phanerochaete sordida]|uniref:Uncharacterized protein n=1 Tax=Phanerochaete sordida TaxID=48140 RepID=A0A9P3LDE5_9APHY|nr:hypothetical protein PsYK624_059570 [Phanerochaete sordida]
MASAKLLQDVPFDVYDYIFDTVRLNDVDTRKRALFAASQTCKAWAAMTLRARFHTLSLIVKLPGEESIVNFFLQDFAQEPVFAKLVQDSCVKSLTLRWSRAEAWSEVDFGTILPEYLPLFPGLRALRLRGVLYKRPDQPITQRFSLRSLAIDGHLYNYHSHKSHNPRALCDLLCLFPTLQVLTLHELRDWARRGLQDDIYDGGPLPTIRSVVVQKSTCPPVLFRFLQSTDIRAADVSDNYTGEFQIVEACAATVEHVRGKLSYQLFVDSLHEPVSNIDLSPLIALRRLMLRVVFPAEPEPEEDEMDLGSLWRTLAEVLAAARRRSTGAPALDIELELELDEYPVDRTAIGPGAISKTRRALTCNLPFVKYAEEELGKLIDGGIVGSVTVLMIAHGLRRSAREPHSCLNHLLRDAFPTVHKKGCLHLSHDLCTCDIFSETSFLPYA